MLLYLLFSFFFSDFIIGRIVRQLYFKQRSGWLYRTTYTLRETKAQTLVLGSSRASHHYVPAVFINNLNSSFYNGGRDGTSLFYHYAMLLGILKRYKPKIIVLDLLKDELDFNQGSYDRITDLLPYYNANKEIRDIVNLRSSYEKYKLVSQMYPFNSLLSTILVGNLYFNKKRFSDIDGYIPLSRKYFGKLIDIKSPEPKLDKNKIKIYKSFIQYCKNKEVDLFIVVSPYLVDEVGKNSVALMKKIAKDNNIVFWDFSEDNTFFKQSRLFFDPEHLNDSGAHVFSQMIVEDIKKELK